MPALLRITLRFFLPAIILFGMIPVAGAANEGDFNGTWTAWLCPRGMQADPGKCGSFMLALFQKQNHLCGSHVYASAGAAEMDEGGAPSISGTITNGVATIVTESGRSDIRIRAELRPAGTGVLEWRRLETPVGDYQLPLKASLTPSKHGSLFNAVFEQRLTAACGSVLTMALDRDRQKEEQLKLQAQKNAQLAREKAAQSLMQQPAPQAAQASGKPVSSSSVQQAAQQNSQAGVQRQNGLAAAQPPLQSRPETPAAQGAQPSRPARPTPGSIPSGYGE